MGYTNVTDDQWKPAWVRVGKDKVSATKLLGRRLVPSVIRPKGAGKGLVTSLAPELVDQVAVIEPAPPGKVWVGFPIPGSTDSCIEVIVTRGQGVRTGVSEGLVFSGTAWNHVHLMSEQDF